MKIYKAALFICFLGCDTYHNDIPPETAAVKWANDMGLKVQGNPNCTQIDTDRDGYITCTIALTQTDMPVKLMSLQCAVVTAKGCEMVNSTYAVGCKETIPKITVNKE